MNTLQIAVVGAGQMGMGIAQVSAQSKLTTGVFLLDQTSERAEEAKVKIHSLMKRGIEKGKWNEDHVRETLAKIHCRALKKDDSETFSNLDFVIEAVSENFSLKKDIFHLLDKPCPEKTIFASNTSSISITSLAATTSRPDRFVGMHFMNPVPVMELVEGIRGLQTSSITVAKTKELAIGLGKTFVEVRDIPGFAVNRILMPMINEAIQAVYEGIATVDQIDISMKLGTNQPMGPLTLADFIGLDTCLAIMKVMHAGFNDSKYRPSPLLQQFVDAGWLGKKTKKGFYDYSGSEPKPVRTGSV